MHAIQRIQHNNSSALEKTVWTRLVVRIWWEWCMGCLWRPSLPSLTGWKWHWSEADAELYCSSILSLFNRLSHEANLSMVLVRATDSSNRFVKLLTSNSAAAKGKEYRPSICQLCGSVSPVPMSFCCPSSWTSSTTICCPNSWAFSSSVLLCRLLHPQDNHHFH